MAAARARTLLRPALLVAVLLALAFFARQVNWAATWQAVRGASPGLLVVAAVVNMAALALKGMRWWLFLRAVGVPSLALALRATFAGAALNNILVANAGEAGRVVMVARSTRVASEQVLATLALDRLFEFAGYVVMLAAAVSLLRVPPALHAQRPYAFGVLAVVVGLLVYLARHPERAARGTPGAAGIAGRLSGYGLGFLRTLTGISTGRRFTAAMLISVVVWSLQVATYQLTARAAGFDIPIVGTVATILAVNLGFAVRATPGNVGVFQAIYALTAAAFGMDADAALGVALLIQAQQILPITVLGLLAAPEVLSMRRRVASGASL